MLVDSQRYFALEEPVWRNRNMGSGISALSFVPPLPRADDSPPFSFSLLDEEMERRIVSTSDSLTHPKTLLSRTHRSSI